MTNKSLYERLGGAKGIASLVDGIVEAHMANPIIQARFLPYADKPDVVERVKKHTCNFLGPELEDLRPMSAAACLIRIGAWTSPSRNTRLSPKTFSPP